MSHQRGKLLFALFASALAAPACEGEATTPPARTVVLDASELPTSTVAPTVATSMDEDARVATPPDASVRSAATHAALPADAGVEARGAVREQGNAIPQDANAAPDAARATDASVSSSVADAGQTPRAADRSPLPGSEGAWTYSEFPDTQCRDGTPAGVAVNLGSANKLLLFLEGGGWCGDPDTCALNPARASDQIDLLGFTYASGGIFDRSNPANPVRDWSFVYVPYCTGDLHSGVNPEGNVPEVGPQKFVGRLNLERFLERIVPTFQGTRDVLLTGSSAGGFGAYLNSLLVQRAFPALKVKLVSDSGPLLSKAVHPECLQERQRTRWKLDDTILAECGASCPSKTDYMEDYGVFVAKTFSDRPSGLIESTGDWVIRAFLGTGNDNCTYPLDIFDQGISSSAFRAAVLSFRERVRPFPNFGTFMPEDETHTWLWISVPGSTGDFFNGSAGGVKLVDWFAKIIQGESPGHAGP
jgi:Pectinacetylesterase